MIPVVSVLTSLRVSQSAELCSQAVIAIVSLISPMPFHGDWWPYFTVNLPASQTDPFPSSSALLVPPLMKAKMW